MKAKIGLVKDLCFVMFFVFRRDAINRVSTDKANDPGMIREVVSRRLRHPEWQKPDIIILDGGKPQVSAVYSLLVETRLIASLQNNNIFLIGLAKKEETIIIKDNLNWLEIKLPFRSGALRLFQNLRNEAHRFANCYRKELIKKSIEI